MLVALALCVLPETAHAARNLLAGDSSFETGYGVWAEAGVRDATTAFDGRQSVRLTGRMATQQQYPLSGGKTYTFSVYLRAEQPGTEIALSAPRADWSGDESRAVVSVGREWRRYSLSVTPQPDTSPKVWLCVDTGQPDKVYWMDACQLEEGAMTPYQSAEPVSVACQVESPVAGHLFYPEEKVKLTFRLYNSQPETASATLSYAVRDYYGTAVKSGTVSVPLPAHDAKSRQVTLGLLRTKGFYLVTYGLPGAAQTASFCVVDHPLPASPGEASLFGLASIPEERVPAAARMGVRWSEAHFIWPWIEKEKGTLDAPALAEAERYLEALNRNGINAIGRLNRTANWAGEYPAIGENALPREDALPAYEDYVYRIVSRFKDRIHFWMNWGGEDDLTVKSYAARMGKSEDWVTERMAGMMKAGYRGAKRADPSCVYGGAGQPSGVDCGEHYPHSRKVFALAGDSIDVFHLDCYTWPRTFKQGWKVQSPEDLPLTDELKEALTLAGSRRCWISEYGFALAGEEALDSMAAKQFADYMARSYLLTATVPRIEMLQWFSCWNCEMEDGSSYDIWRWPNPLPVVAAYSALAQVLTGAASPREVPMGGALRAVAFDKKKGSLAALWVPANTEVAIRLPRTPGLRIVDVMGNEVRGGAGSLQLTGSPVYLLSDKPADALVRALSEASIDLEPVRAEVQVVDVRTVRVHLLNQINAPLRGVAALTLPLKGEGARQVQGAFQDLAPGAAAAVEVRLPEEMDLAQLQDYHLAGEVTTQKGKVALGQTLSLTPCPRADKKISVDGDLSEWEGRPSFELRDTSSLIPPDAAVHGVWAGPEDLSATAHLAWDDDRLYFAAEVRDDVIKNDRAPDEIWAGDSVQIAFDTKNDALRMMPPGYGADDREFCFGQSEKLQGPTIYRTWPAPGGEPRAELAIVRQGERTRYELSLPWQELGDLRPEPGTAFGFSFVVNDRDLGEAVDYCLGLTPGLYGGQDASAFRKIVLVGGR